MFPSLTQHTMAKGKSYEENPCCDLDAVLCGTAHHHVHGHTVTAVTDVAVITTTDKALQNADEPVFVQDLVRPGLASWKVTFVTSGASAVPQQMVPQGGQLEKPADPARTGYVFTGWFRDAALKRAKK